MGGVELGAAGAEGVGRGRGYISLPTGGGSGEGSTLPHEIFRIVC